MLKTTCLVDSLLRSVCQSNYTNYHQTYTQDLLEKKPLLSLVYREVVKK